MPRAVTRSYVIASLKELAVSLGSSASGTEWHLFGSANRDAPYASDIDLMIFCESDAQADILRHSVDPDSLPLPLHLSLLTFNEAKAINAASVQQSAMVFKLPSKTGHQGCPEH